MIVSMMDGRVVALEPGQPVSVLFGQARALLRGSPGRPHPKPDADALLPADQRLSLAEAAAGAI